MTRSLRTSPTLRLTLLVVAVVAIAGAAYGGWYVFLRPSGPAPVGSSDQPAASFSAVAEPASLDGTWSVTDAIGTVADGTGTFVGYRVQEQLANIGGNTAVGRTGEVAGTLTLQGSTVSAAEITATLTGLTSDDSRRDGQLRRQGIQTDQFPTASFRLTAPIALGAVPADGATVTAMATGDFTLHGVTKSASVALSVTRAGGLVTVTGSFEIAFADYAIEKPTSFAVLSIDDTGTVELQLHFVHS